MSDAEWDADDYEPKEATTGPVVADKWEGEDSDDDIKDNWDDEEDENKDKEEGTTVVESTKKKPLKVRLAEKEAKRKAEREAKQKAEEEANSNLTPEEIAAEKARQQKMLEDADLELAKDAFGVGDEECKGIIDAFSPHSKEDFDKFQEVLKNKITNYEKSPHYVSFLDGLYRDLSISLESDDLKKLGSTLNALANEKSKQQKAAKGKKKKGVAKLNAGRDDNYDDYGLTASYDNEFDDFI